LGSQSDVRLSTVLWGFESLSTGLARTQSAEPRLSTGNQYHFSVSILYALAGSGQQALLQYPKFRQ
jgi:hypothetical protein